MLMSAMIAKAQNAIFKKTFECSLMNVLKKRFLASMLEYMCIYNSMRPILRQVRKMRKSRK